MAEGPAPRISVVVPVRDRRALLRRMLDALDAQRYRDFEVVVVDDGSTDGSAEEALADARAGRPVRLERGPGSGAVAARIRGVSVSRGEYLAFTDSDCEPDPGWLEAGVAALDAGADVVAGLTVAARPAAPLERTVESGEEGLYPTCNVFYRRAAYERAGGFDERAGARYGFAGGTSARHLGFGEDTLLGWRVRRAGRAAFAPDALVRHHVFPVDVRDTLRRTWMMRAFPGLFREVPELRSGPLVRHGVLLAGPSRLPVYAAVAALATRRPQLAAASVAWWLAARSRDLGGRRAGARLAHLPALLAIDVVTAAALTVGSVTHREVVL